MKRTQEKQINVVIIVQMSANNYLVALVRRLDQLMGLEMVI
jgi:hypothetical protein